MRNQPIVTVYITNYNYAQYLQQSITSVLNQTLQDFELIIIDDGSTDNSKEIIGQYRNDERFTIIFQQNKGLNVSNNIAMRAANGKYIVRLDADDFLESWALKEMVDVLEQDPTLGLVFPDYYYVNELGERTGEERRHNFDKEVSLYDQPAHGACTMIRLEYLKHLGGYNESFTCQDGYDLWLKFITHYRVTNINKPLFSYRRHSANLTLNEDKILSTRKKIKDVFVNQNFLKPSTLAVIPVRSSKIGDVNWPMFEWDGKPLLVHKVNTCLNSHGVKAVVVSVSDDELMDWAGQLFVDHERVHVLRRPKSFAGPNESLYNTLIHALEYANANVGETDAIMSVSLDYPFTQPDVLEEAINTLVLFKSDSVLSVRIDTNVFYQHTGHSLQPILNQDRFTRLEREALYRGAGGIMLTTVQNLLREKKIVSGRVSHVVVSQKNAFGVFTPFDFQLMKGIVQFAHAGIDDK
jgi:CMP-N-acetylneuraminic acid synthetase